MIVHFYLSLYVCCSSHVAMYSDTNFTTKQFIYSVSGSDAPLCYHNYAQRDAIPSSSQWHVLDIEY